jgi:hypothetical protein
VNIQVFNLMGDLFFTENVINGKFSFDTKSWTKSLYVIRIGDRSSRLIVN